MSLLDPLISFIKETGFRNIPQEVIEQAKIRIIDLISACGIGYLSGVKNPFWAFASIYKDSQRATIFFNQKRSFAPHAAACNTFLANSSGMEDGSRFAGAHPSSAIIPSAVAAAEMIDASGQDLITAIVTAYDIYLRIGYALYPNNLKKGFQASAILAPIGSAAAAGKILNLDFSSLKSCLSLACLSASGLKVAFDEYESKCYQIAKGVKAGMEACLFAQKGLKGPDRVLEGGFLKAYGGEEGRLELRNLGSSFYLLQTYVKVHAGCRLIHPCIDAILFLREKERIFPEQVEMVSIGVTSAAREMEKEKVKNVYDARLNTPFLVALALKNGEVSENQITEEALKDRIIKDLLGKIKVDVDPELDQKYPSQRGAKVIIRLKDGRSIYQKIDFAEGEPETPLSMEKIREKFQRALEKLLSNDKVTFLYQFLSELERQDSVHPLCKELGGFPKVFYPDEIA